MVNSGTGTPSACRRFFGLPPPPNRFPPKHANIAYLQDFLIYSLRPPKMYPPIRRFRENYRSVNTDATHFRLAKNPWVANLRQKPRMNNRNIVRLFLIHT